VKHWLPDVVRIGEEVTILDEVEDIGLDLNVAPDTNSIKSD
jgi:hypothetical protein